MSDTLKRKKQALRMEAMRSGIRLKNDQVQLEPWKALAAAFGAGVAVTVALGTGIAWVMFHMLRGMH